MNKVKKISMAVVATVMAGAMIVPLAACGGTKTPSGPTRPVDGVHEVETGLSVKTKDGVLDYAEGTKIDTALGYDNPERGIKFTSKLITDAGFGGAGVDFATFAGVKYNNGDLKPAWRELSSVLGIEISDTWAGTADEKAGVHIETLTKRPEGNGLNDRGLITASADTIVTEAVSNDSFLDINKYLDYIPNYKAFIEADDAVRLSVTADTSTGAMYLIPYFDGNNDIEKYVLMRKDIVEKILDATDLTAATGTFAGQAQAKNAATEKGVVDIIGTQSSVKSFMGKVAEDNYEIDVTDPAALDENVKSFGNDSTAVKKGHDKDTVTLVVDYGKVITALKDTQSDLYDAVEKALPDGTTVQIASGNIIDIQNQIINETSGTCTGAQLTKVLQEYIKVAYHKKGETTAFYTKLSDVFNSAYAAWDVDLYVALGRCAMTSNGLLGTSTKGEAVSYFLGSRAMQTKRNYNEASMAGEFYGIRGLTSRYSNLYTYIGADGKMRDARANPETWDALNNMHALVLEGLLYSGTGVKEHYGSIAGALNTGVQFYSSTDYVQTQTANGGFAVDGSITTNTAKVEGDYNFAPILTPVSRWDTDDNGSHETVMRFTESWRAVKDGGICIPKEYVKNNPDRLSAVLAVIDWMYSNDGQMVLTYGPHSEGGNVTREQGKVENDNYGTWYGNPVTSIEGVTDVTNMEGLKTKGIVDTYDGVHYFVTKDYQSQYLCYGNKLYTGYLYNGKQVPIPTDEFYTVFYTNTKSGSFTDTARHFIGSALNFGNKDQGFEAQCTAKCGLAGASIWAIANVNGTIKHTLNKIDSNNWWYTLSPTVLPFDESATASMKTQYQLVSGKGSTAGTNYFYQGNDASNLLMDIIYYGYNAEGGTQKVTGFNTINIPTSAQGVIDLLNNVYQGHGLDKVDEFMEEAWDLLKDYYDELQAKH